MSKFDCYVYLLTQHTFSHFCLDMQNTSWAEPGPLKFQPRVS
jgi:hypothetical protein